MRKRALASLLIGIAISLIGLWYAFTSVDLAAMASSMARVDAGWLAANVGCSLLFLVVWAIRWRFLPADRSPTWAGDRPLEATRIMKGRPAC